MNIEKYLELIRDIRALSEKGWTYIYMINGSENDNRIMSHKEHGEHSFDTWLKLRLFVDKQLDKN